MKQRLQGVIIGFVLALSLNGVISLAATGYKTIEIWNNNIRLFIDGSQIVPTDASGAYVEPFSYNGTVYLPVRAVATAIGKAVEWDAVGNTVYIGYKPGSGDYLGESLRAYINDSVYEFPSKGYFKMAGITYKKGIVNSNFRQPCGAVYNLGGKYTSLSGLCGPVDGAAGDATITFYGDDVAIKTIYIQAGQYPIEFDVKVTNVKKLRVQFDGLDGGRFALADPIVK